MHRSLLHPLRRCRLLLALALCAWLGLAGSVFAHDDCCAGMQGLAVALTMSLHRGVPAPLHADGGHADCACAHATATVPELSAPAVPVHPVATTWQAWPTATPERPRAPPLRPPLD